MKTEKHKPLRMCVACREMKEKEELFRIVKPADDAAFYDISGTADGRGAYICRKEDCIKNAEKRNAVSRAFKSETDRGIYEKLLNLL